MKIGNVRRTVMYILFVGKITIIIWSFLIWLAKGYSTNEVLSIISIISPLLGAHLGVIIQFYFQKNYKEFKGGDIIFEGTQTFLSFLIPIIYITYMTLILLLKPIGVIEEFENVKTFITIGETTFGLYLGVIITRLYST